MSEQILIVGAGGQGKVVADIAKLTGYKRIVFLDDNDEVKECGGYPVVGNSEDASCYQDYDCILAIGNSKTRQKVMTSLQAMGMSMATLIHPSAIVASDVMIGEGSVVMAGAVISPGARIGRGCIINTCASVNHDCELGEFVHVSVGAHVAGTVTIGDHTWIGAGAIVSNNITITKECMIGAGAVVVTDLLETGVYIGVPARPKTGSISG